MVDNNFLRISSLKLSVIAVSAAAGCTCAGSHDAAKMTTTTMTSLVTRRFDDEWRLLAVVSPFPAVRVDFLLAAAAAFCVALTDVDGALRFLSR